MKLEKSLSVGGEVTEKRTGSDVSIILRSKSLAERRARISTGSEN